MLYRLLLIACVIGCLAPAHALHAQRAQEVSVALPDTTVAPDALGSTLLLPVRIPQALDGTEYPYSRGSLSIEGIISFDLVVTYDPAHLRLTGVVQDDTSTEGWMVAINDRTDGELRVSGTSTGDPLKGPAGPLLFLTAEVLGGGRSAVTFSTMRFNDGTADATPGHVRIGEP
ncbi:MAG: hypothetical protein GVY12_08700 [Bacteroidetes bacterium]|nr:hypothetical protein [Bacteroidota bacterium]